MSYMSEANAIAEALRGTGKATPRSQRPATARQLEVLAYMREFFAAEDQLPPKAYVARHFGWASPNTAQDHIDGLVRCGLVERNVCGKLRFPRPAAKDGAA